MCVCVRARIFKYSYSFFVTVNRMIDSNPSVFPHSKNDTLLHCDDGDDETATPAVCSCSESSSLAKLTAV